MGFFDTEEGVRQYLEMAEGYDGRDLVATFEAHLPAGSSVLELGMGPGKDLDLLRSSFEVTGSDASKAFLDLYRQQAFFTNSGHRAQMLHHNLGRLG